MPKEKREKKSPALRHDPLGKQISRDALTEVAVRARPVDSSRAQKAAMKGGEEEGEEDEEEEEEEEEAFLSPGMTKKILEQATKQRQEQEQQSSGEGKKRGAGRGPPSAFYADLDSDIEDVDVQEEEYDSEEEEELVIDENDYGYGASQLSASEEALVSSFMGGGTRRNLADIIMDKIREKEEAAMNDEDGGAQQQEEDSMPPKVVEVYTQIGKILSRYTAGKLPKAFKIIPSLTNWEEVLWLTRPDQWSAHAMYAATRIFSSNFNPRMAQRFYNVFLLERCREDVSDNRRLNYHLYESLMKSVYKPAAFYKGILLPLASSGNCSLREATIFGSVLARVSIPANHSAVALLKLAEMPYSGASSLFIRVLLNKKYSLPFKVIDRLVDHFVGFVKETRELPVLWHQSILTFAQRYKLDIKAADKERLKDLLKVQHHPQITPEIRRELCSTKSRGESKLDTSAEVSPMIL